MSSGSQSRGMKQPLMPAIEITKMLPYAETCESVFTNVAKSSPNPVAASDVQAMTGNNAIGCVPHDMPNSSLPARNSTAVWQSEIRKNGSVLPASKPAGETGAIRNRLSVLLTWAYQYFTFQRGIRLITRARR